MKDERKIKRIKKILLIVGILFGLVFTFLIGSSTGYYRGVKKMTSTHTKTTNKKEKDVLLTQSEVQKFLIAYYTKEDLGENQNRYKPFMTDSLYQSTKEEEQLPIQQAYKGYVVNQVFQKATIYIDQKNHTAVCLVSFKNTQRVKKGSDERAIKNQSNQQNIKLTYQLIDGRYKVNQMKPIVIDENITELDKNSYPSDRIQLPTQLMENSASEAVETSSSDTKQEESSNQVTESKSAESDKTETSTPEKSTNEENQKSEEPKNKDMQAIIDSSK